MKTTNNVEFDNNSINTKTGNIVSQNQEPLHRQGKITEYLPEMKDLARKEKLDKTAKLNSCSMEAMDSSSKHHMINLTKD